MASTYSGPDNTYRPDAQMANPNHPSATEPSEPGRAPTLDEAIKGLFETVRDLDAALLVLGAAARAHGAPARVNLRGGPFTSLGSMALFVADGAPPPSSLLLAEPLQISIRLGDDAPQQPHEGGCSKSAYPPQTGNEVARSMLGGAR